MDYNSPTSNSFENCSKMFFLSLFTVYLLLPFYVQITTAQTGLTTQVRLVIEKIIKAKYVLPSDNNSPKWTDYQVRQNWL